MDDMHKDKNWGINLHQQNVAHRLLSHDAIMAWLHQEKREWILCLQEPYIGKRGMSKLPMEHGAFWSEQAANGNSKTRTAIIAPKRLHGYMVTQLSDVDCTIVRFDNLKFTVVSLYCSIDVDIRRSWENVVKECGMMKRVIISADVNAYHKLWGSMFRKKLQYRGIKRGLELVDIVDENGLEIVNKIPHMATFVRHEDGRKKGSQMSHIDVTVGTAEAAEKIRNWKVVDEVYFADHRCIRCEICCKVEKKMEKKEEGIVRWKKPTEKMERKMRGGLIKEVKYKRRMKNAMDVEKFIDQHCVQIRDILQKIFQSGKERQQRREMYWWSKEVEEAHGRLKVARRRMRRYKYSVFRDEFNMMRSEFRKSVQNAKQEAWKKLMTNVTDPWDGLVKILKATSIGKIQSRTLADITGKFAEDLDSTLVFLGKQFYPDPAPMLESHMKIEQEVERKLEQWKGEEIPIITKCEYRKALGDMTVGTAPGFDMITNNVIKILSEDAKYKVWYLKVYNFCLQNSFFPTEWKKSKIVLIPKGINTGDTVKAFRPISLTSAFAKLLERVVLGRINYHLEEKGYLKKSQHAYRKGMSTQTALLKMFEVVQYAMNRKEICLIVFLDISGAFDRTWHHGILHRLLGYGVPSYLAAWLKEFLNGRTAFFMEGNSEHEVNLEQGCPQGGVLSPALWNVLFNDFLAIPIEGSKPRGNQLKVIGYADDAAIVCKASTGAEASKLVNAHLQKVYE